jgi:two-component system OmpR family sensor kinase
LKLRWLTTGLPLILSLGIMALMINGQLQDSVFRLRLNEATLVVVVGILLSAMLAVNFIAQERLLRIHQQSMEKARAETAEEHRRFLNRLDHEMKNPLMAIRAGLANLRSTTDEAAQQPIMDGIDTQAMRLSHLVVDLRKVAEIGTRPLECSPISASDLLREAVATVQDDPLAQERVLVLNLPHNDVLINGDRDLLVLALHNLLNNALKFTCPENQISVCGFSDGSLVTFEVADDGPGIPEAERSQVWKELYRGQAAQGVPGNGIGLSLVQAITERHGGQATLQSAPGKGTVVTIRLPIHHEDDLKPVHSPVRPPFTE